MFWVHYNNAVICEPPVQLAMLDPIKPLDLGPGALVKGDVNVLPYVLPGSRTKMPVIGQIVYIRKRGHPWRGQSVTVLEVIGDPNRPTFPLKVRVQSHTFDPVRMFAKEIFDLCDIAVVDYRGR